MPSTLQPAPIPSFRGDRRRRRTKLIAAVAGVALLVPVGFGIADAVDRWMPDPPAAQTVDRSPAALLLAMRDVADYHAASGTYQVLVDVEQDSPYLPSMISGERSTLFATGTVDGRVDFSGLGPDAIHVSDDRRSATITLGASDDLVARARAVGARDARLGPVAAPRLAPPRRTRAAVRAEFRLAPGAPLILSVGRLHPQKRYDLLIDASARWRELTPPPVVVVAGSGPSYMSLAQRSSERRAPFHLLGRRSDVPDLLGGDDLAVVTSDWEARQLFAQEALTAGTPLIATAVGGVPGLVGDAALLIPPGDVDALDQAVRRLLADPGLRADYAARGPARAATWPGEQDTVAAVRAVYAEVTARV